MQCRPHHNVILLPAPWVHLLADLILLLTDITRCSHLHNRERHSHCLIERTIEDQQNERSEGLLLVIQAQWYEL